MIRRISTKLTLAASLAITLVMIPNAIQRVRRETQLFEADIRRDHQVLGRALAETTGALAERAGVEEALLALSELDQRRAHLTIRWVLDRRARDESEIVTLEEGRFLETHVPVTMGSDAAGYISLRESLLPEERYTRESIGRVAVWALITILTCALLIHLAGYAILARPLAPILAKIDRVGRGDWEGPLALARTDELGVDRAGAGPDVRAARAPLAPCQRRGRGAHRRHGAAPARRPARDRRQARLRRRPRARHPAQRRLGPREDDPRRRVRGR